MSPVTSTDLHRAVALDGAGQEPTGRGSEDLRRLVRDLGPFRNLDPGGAVFYADVERGVRVALTVRGPVTGITPSSLLIACQGGGWEIFGDHRLLAGMDEDGVQVTVQG